MTEVENQMLAAIREATHQPSSGSAVPVETD